MIEDPEVSPDTRVIVVATHHDDVIVGCGGTLCKLAKRGAQVKVLFMTETSYGSPFGPSAPLVRMVDGEAEETMARLHCFEVEHLNLPGMPMNPQRPDQRRLLRAIDYCTPDIVFLPSVYDPHPDNVVTGLMTARALREYHGNLTLYTYEVWGGLLPNTLVEITEVMKEKIAAINARLQQTGFRQGGLRLKELNSIRLFAIQEERCCEPFFRQDIDDFLTMASRLGVYDADGAK